MNSRNCTRRSFLGSSTAMAATVRAYSSPSPPSQSRVGQLKAGAATANITPSLGCSLAGGMTDRIGVEVHDELHVRSLVLDDGARKLAFAVVDSCAVPREVIDKAKALIQNHTGIPPSAVMVSATHTHSAPPAAHLFQSRPDPAYQAFLTTRIADSVRVALSRLEPARIGWGVGSEASLVFNRRYYMNPGAIPTDPFGRTRDRVRMNPTPGSRDLLKPAGPTDPDVQVLAIESLKGHPISVFASYALHYAGGAASGHITADYFGAWAEAMIRLSGVDSGFGAAVFVPILANGCSGNINGVNFRKPSGRAAPYERMRQYAEVLAAETYRVWKNIHFQDSVQLAASTEELELGVRLPSMEEVKAARGILASAKKNDEGQYTERVHIYARETVLLSEYPRTLKTVLQAMRIGELGMATLPGEAFVELGLEVKEKSPFRPTMMIELANDYRGYIPTVEGHRVGGYETWRAKSSYLEVQAAPKMVSSVLRQLHKLSG